MLPVFVACWQISASAAAPLERVAQLIYSNECASRTACLTSWNRGEEFASLGIGHFIWYPSGPADVDKPFRESFPALLAYLAARGEALPDWLNHADGCPWPNRKAFLAAQDAPHMQELRALLMRSMPLQAAFMRQRQDQALSAMLQAAAPGLREHIALQYHSVSASPMGAYVLTDYVNFKGEGTKSSERYHGQGWGLMQVLSAMPEVQPGPDVIRAFARAADKVLSRRVRNAPPGRHEERWLPGWRKRLASYPAEADREMHRKSQP